jgi:hypothetical protein
VTYAAAALSALGLRACVVTGACMHAAVMAETWAAAIHSSIQPSIHSILWLLGHRLMHALWSDMDA